LWDRSPFWINFQLAAESGANGPDRLIMVTNVVDENARQLFGILTGKGIEQKAVHNTEYHGCRAYTWRKKRLQSKAARLLKPQRDPCHSQPVI
jgi:hypothetical protein